MNDEEYTNAAYRSANQKLGGKEIRFPIGGISEKIQSSRLGTRYSPYSVNVMFFSSKNIDFGGGTRPGLSLLGSGESADNKDRWLWPNGEPIQWPDGSDILIDRIGSKTIMPDGSVMYNQHPVFDVFASKGDAPSNCSSASLYRARLVVASDTMWYASRTGDVGDFDYGGLSEDPSRPVAGNVALSGREGEKITAIAAVRDRYLFVATARALWMIDGEPTASAHPISEKIGIVSRDAWCFDGKSLWFVGPSGLYSLSVGSYPVLVSSNVQEHFKGWDSATLVYDVDLGGIHIFGTKNDKIQEWFFDIVNVAFWRLSYPESIRPTSGGLIMRNGVNSVVFLCADGKFRFLDFEAENDCGTAIKSVMTVGPITNTTGDTENGFLAEIDCEMGGAGNTACATVSGIVGRTSHEVFDASFAFANAKISGNDTSEKFSYAVSKGWNRVFRPRVRCNSFAFAVWSESARWEYSKITAVHRGCGRIRK